MRPSEDSEIDTPMAGIRRETGTDRVIAPDCLAERAGDIGCNARPEIPLAVAGKVASEDHAPVRAKGAKTQTAKWTKLLQDANIKAD